MTLFILHFMKLTYIVTEKICFSFVGKNNLSKPFVQKDFYQHLFRYMKIGKKNRSIICDFMCFFLIKKFVHAF